MNRRLALTLAILAVAGVFLLAPVFSESEKGPVSSRSENAPEEKPFFRRQILLGAHRAGDQVWPENTLMAFTKAADRWPEVLLETDANLTADGTVVLLHDDTVDRTTDGTGAIDSLPYEEVRRLDGGYRFTQDGGATYPFRGKGLTIPTLKEVLEALPESHFLIELKPRQGVADAVAQVIKETQAEDRVLIASFVPAVMRRARSLLPNAAVCYDFENGLALLTCLREGDWGAYKPEADVLSLMRRMLKEYSLTAEDIRAIQDKGIRFQIHTVNDPDEMRHMLDLGADSILTDRPDLLADVIAEWRAGSATRAAP